MILVFGSTGLLGMEFDVLITVDRKLSTQQDISKFKIAVLLIRGKTNRLEDLRPLVPKLLGALPTTKPRELTVVGG